MNLALLVALGAGLIAGGFLALSSFVCNHIRTLASTIAAAAAAASLAS